VKRRALLGSLALLGAPLARGGIYDDVKIGMSTPADRARNGVYVWIDVFRRSIEHAGLRTRVYPNSTIGGERERTIQMQLGLLQLNASGGYELSRWSPLLAAMARPFLVDSYAHMSRLLTDTPFLAGTNRALAPHGLRLLDFAYTASMTGLFTRGRPVRRVDELRPLRLRVLSRADQHLLNAWRVRGVQVAWEEVAQALQTGIVDAYLNPPNVAPMFGHGTVLDYFTDLRMGPAARLIVAAADWLDGLTPAEARAVYRAVASARTANRLWLAAAGDADRKRLRDSGIEWIAITDAQRASWIEASQQIKPGRWEDPAATARYLQWLENTRAAPGGAA
jgi:TRAP-type C4-dicarboxylate transport system substrate-binding protein